MDLIEHLFLSSSLVEDFAQIVTHYELPLELQSIVRHAASYFPAEIGIFTALQFLLIFTAGSLILGTISRLLLGKRSSLNHSLSSAVGILFIYVLTAVIYTFKAWDLDGLLSPLPFVRFSGEYLIVLPITDLTFPALCTELLSLVILAFLVNLMDICMPRGKHILTWYVLRFLTVVLAMLLHYLVRGLLYNYLPQVLVTYAPMVLLGILLFMLLSGLLNLILGLVITMANPFLGAMYTFFFSNIIGKQVSKAVFSSAVLCAVVFLVEYFGFSVICITVSALAAYLPAVLVLLLLWYLIGHVL